jgi:hypothetical protein
VVLIVTARWPRVHPVLVAWCAAAAGLALFFTVAPVQVLITVYVAGILAVTARRSWVTPATLAICAGAGALIVSLILFAGAGQQPDSMLLLFVALGASVAAGTAAAATAAAATAAAATAAARLARGPGDPLALRRARIWPGGRPADRRHRRTDDPPSHGQLVGPYPDGRDDRRVGASPCRRACRRPAHRQHRGLEHRKSAATSAAG